MNLRRRIGAIKRDAYGRIALIFAVCLLPFTITRFVLYTVYHSEFSRLGLRDLALAFVTGLRFDASIAVMGVGVPLLLMLAPFSFNHHYRVQRIWSWLAYGFLLCLIFMLAADTFYFGVVRRHAGPEISALASDIPSMISLALHDFPWALTAFATAAIFGARAWHALVFPVPAPPTRHWPRLIAMTALLALFVFVGRGGLQYKPLSVSDAFFSDSAAAGYLVLNGPFSLAHALEEEKPVVKDFMPMEDAVRVTQQWLGGARERFSDPRFPLLRTTDPAPHASTRPPNVVILLLESWDASNVDAERVARGKPARGVTPNFDQLARGGRLYTHFYAVGQRSIEGIAGLLAGVPTTPGMPPLGVGLEQNRLTYLGELAKAQGYRTIFLQSSNRGSFHVDAIAARAGFDTYLGAEDIPELHTDKERNAGWGAWDHNTLQAAHRLFAREEKPFFAFIFTSSTHSPFATPTQRWKKIPEKTERDKFLNTVYYTDWALGEWVAAAKRAGYFDNTVFVITGDHASPFIDDADAIPNRYRVPLVLAGPGISPGIDHRTGGHTDVMPTLTDLLGWRATYAAFGSSLLDDGNVGARAALGVRGTLVDWISADEWLSHDLTHRLGASPNLGAQRANDMERQLTAAFQVVSHALIENRITQ